MKYGDFTKTRRIIHPYEVSATFSQLVEKTCERIHALSIFYSVGPRIREQPLAKCPACIVIPNSVEIAEHHLAGARFDYRFSVSIGFALKNANDCVIMQQALYFEEKIRIAFSKGDNAPILVFSDVDGHYCTKIVSSAIEPVRLISNNVLAFSSGINVVYWVWQSI